MYRVLLVDDEPILQVGIRKMLEGSDDYEISASARNGVEALQCLQNTPVDMILTDLKMPVMDGVALIKTLKQQQNTTPVIVLSNYSDFELVREALTSGALDYVLKPVSYYAFSQRLSRAIERVARRARHYLQINAHGTAHKLDTSSIYWVESNAHDLVYRTAEGELTAPGSMTELEQKLAQDSYFRVNKGCLVNLEHVDQMDGEDAVVHGDRVPLARARRKAFLDALNDYINGVG